MKPNLFGRKLDNEFVISRMDVFESVAYHFIYKDTEYKNKDWICVIDQFIQSCLSYDIIVREHLYYPKNNRG